MAWTDRYVSPTGAGTHAGTVGNEFTLAEAITDAATPHTEYRYNIIAGTYANTTNTRTFSGAGTTTAPIWWRGYKTSIGDLDDMVTLPRSLQDGVNLPLITFTTGQMVVSGAHQIFSNLDITSQCTTANGAVAITGGNAVWIGMRVENTAANSAAKAGVAATTSPAFFFSCRFKATTTANIVFNPSVSAHMIGCLFIGGIEGFFASNNAVLDSCVIYGFTTNGVEVNQATSHVALLRCTIYAAATNAILVSTIPTTGDLSISNCILGGCTNGINNSTGGNTNGIRQFRNHFYSCTNNLVGIQDIAAYSDDLGVLLHLMDNDTDPFVAKASGDFTLVSAAIDKSAGLPGVFEGQTAMVSYPDIGAVRHIDPAASGGLLVHPGMAGGMRG